MPFSKSADDRSPRPLDVARCRAELHAWLEAHQAELAPRHVPPGTLDERVAQMQRVKSILFEAGWMQLGWPERVGGRGGPPAEALVAVEALEASLGAAREEPGPDTAALAKAIAGRSALAVARHCQQVLAGIGFTAEHPFHRLAKRTLALEGVLGSADRIVLDAGRRLLAGRRVPTLIEL
ncbi:MAG: acyl-CoA dehydrogenase family protein [Thermodesulfobacteriota bacterium]